MSGRDQRRYRALNLPVLDAEMWEAPERLSHRDCLEEIAGDLRSPDRDREDDQ